MICSRFLTLTLILALGVLCAPNAYSLPLNKRHDSVRGGRFDQPVTVKLNVASVGDEVNYSPNLSGGGYAPKQSRPRYQAAELAIGWQLSHRLFFQGSIRQQEFTTTRDSFKLHAYSLELHYDFPDISSHRRYAISFGAASNRTPIIDKNSYSSYGDQLLTSVQVHQPYDIQAQINFTGSVDLNRSVTWSAFTGLGYAITDHSSISGIGESDNGCQYQFEVGNGAGSLDQIGPCGDLLQFSQEYPDYEAVQSNLGFDPDSDIKSQSAYWQIGTNFQFRKGRVGTSFNYYYQQFNRGEFDQRIVDRGNTPVSGSHTISTRLDYYFSDQFTLAFDAEYQSRQFLNKVPVLYTGVTSDRFTKDVVYFTISLSFSIASGGS